MYTRMSYFVVVLHFDRNIDNLTDREVAALEREMESFKEYCRRNGGKFSMRMPSEYGRKRVELICTFPSQVID